jgi:hypothetical protein
MIPALTLGIALCAPLGVADAQWGRGYGPMGPGMMQDWTPEERRQHWEQMQRYGRGPSMMRNMTPEERERHWEWMRERGYGPGMMRGRRMMGPGMMGPCQGAGCPRAGQPPITTE